MSVLSWKVLTPFLVLEEETMDAWRKQHCFDWRKGRGICNVRSPTVKGHDAMGREPESIGMAVELVVDLVVDHAPGIPWLVRVHGQQEDCGTNKGQAEPT